MKTFRSRICLLAIISGLLALTVGWAGWWYSGQSTPGFWIGGGLALVVSTATCYFIVTPLYNNLLYVLDNTKLAIKGDLTAKIEEKDYGWNEFNLLVNDIRRILKGVHKWFSLVKDTSVTLDDGAEQIIAGTNQVSTGSQNQAEQVNELVKSIENMARMAQEYAKQTEEASKIARNATAAVSKGNTVVKKSLQDMNLLEQEFAQLSQSSENIVYFLEIIQDIAAQTNLLALNAAIEAAQAGEKGRGFAVVADEVRDLADSSERATKEVAQIVDEIKHGISATVNAVQSGLSCSQDIEKVFEEISSSLAQTGTLVEGIARVAKEQSDSTATMLSNAQTIAAVAEEAAATSQESAAVAQELTTSADNLRKVADIWKL